MKYCPVCNNVSQFSTRLYRCTVCVHGHRIVSTIDPLEFHDQVYRQTHQRSKGEIVDGEVTDKFHEQRAQSVKERLSLTSRFLRQSDTVIDIGGGAGTFAALIKDRVAKVSITEVNKQLLTECQKRFGVEARQIEIQHMEDNERIDVVFA